MLLLFSCSFVFDSLGPHGLQHARLPCPSPSPSICLNSGPLSRWCHPTISSAMVPFSSCLQYFPATVLVISRLFASGGESIGASFSFNITPSNEHSGLILFWIDWFDLLAVQGTLKRLIQHHISKASILWFSAFLIVQLSHLCITIWQTTLWLYRPCQ